MKFILNMKRFSRDEDGAVTVDWVVLTAAIVGLAIAAFSAVGDAASDLTVDIASDINTQ
jgi:Flp pilus assembly pilin Flp